VRAHHRTRAAGFSTADAEVNALRCRKTGAAPSTPSPTPSRARRHLWVLRKECGHAALVDPRNLIGKLSDMSFEEAGHKLRCAKCGKARAHFVPKDEQWSSMR
jgi:hypothetical protein